MFGVAFGDSSPFWHAIAREYLELADSPFLDVGHEIIVTVAGAPTGDHANGRGVAEQPWSIGPLTLGARQQAADILSLGHTAAEVAVLVEGPHDLVDQFAERVGRR